MRFLRIEYLGYVRNRTYLLEGFEITVGPDPEESNEWIQFQHAVHHWSAGETPSIGGIDLVHAL